MIMGVQGYNFVANSKTMKKVLILLVALFIGVNFSYAGNDETKDNPVSTTSMSGKIIDKISGETLAGVMVALDGTDKKVFTDFDGNFSFEEITPGEYTISCSLISYKNNEIKIDLNQECEKQLKVELETVN